MDVLVKAKDASEDHPQVGIGLDLVLKALAGHQGLGCPSLKALSRSGIVHPYSLGFSLTHTVMHTQTRYLTLVPRRQCTEASCGRGQQDLCLG